MNITLAGYGKMGREVEAIAIGRGHTIAAIFDEYKLLSSEGLKEHPTDVIIDFTQPGEAGQGVDKKGKVVGAEAEGGKPSGVFRFLHQALVLGLADPRPGEPGATQMATAQNGSRHRRGKSMDTLLQPRTEALDPELRNEDQG